MESRFSALRQPAHAPNGSSKLERAIRVIPKKLADGCVQVLYEATGKDAALDPDLPRQLPKESWGDRGLTVPQTIPPATSSASWTAFSTRTGRFSTDPS